MKTIDLLNAIRQGQYTGTGFKPDGWKFCMSDADALKLLEQHASGDLRSCTICGLTVDVSKGHVAPDPTFTQQGRAKPRTPSCCANEERTMSGGCKNCGDPCL